MNRTVFPGIIVEWYQEHHRRLPWRETRNPYKIWLSEIILQQTRVAQGLPYYRAFVRKYPTVKALASAKEEAVLRQWQGLGYYSRARNLLACAKTVAYLFHGKFPRTAEELRKLKGIGEYTAAAIASFAFDEPVAVVDGNVYRVLARVFGLTDDIASPGGKKKFRALANQLIPRRNPALYNQSIMEFGALHCIPRNPNCETCPLVQHCVAHKQGLQLQLPVKRKAKNPVRRNFYYFAIRKGNKWLMRKRMGEDIWKGLWDFPLYESKARTSAKDLTRLLRKGIDSKADMSISSVFRHVLSHQVIYARFIEVSLPARARLSRHSLFSQSRLLTPRKVSELPKPVLVSRFLGQHGMR